MPIAFSCPACKKQHSVSSRFAGQKAKCTCGAAVNIPAAAPKPPPAEEPAFVDFDSFAESADREPVSAAPTPPPIRRPPSRPPAAPPRARAAPPIPRPGGRPVPSRRNAGKSDDEKGLLAKIGGGILTVLFILGIVGKVLRVVNGGSSRSSSTSSSSDTASNYPASPASYAPRASAAPVESFPTLAPVAASAFPDNVPFANGPDGIRTAAFDVRNAAGLSTRLQVYLPVGAKPGAKLPCVFIAPAGTRLFHGIGLADGDTPEHLPYAKAGMAVVAYSIGGPLSDEQMENESALRGAFDAFRRSQGGYVDAEAAIEYALAKRPEIDPKKLFVAGHSSAASAALLVASKDARIAGCCAYAPETNFDAHFGPAAQELDGAIPGFAKFEHDISPHALPAPRGPVLLFAAMDDTVADPSRTRQFAAKLGAKAKFVSVPTGGHFDSMMASGIPNGIAFIHAATRG